MLGTAQSVTERDTPSGEAQRTVVLAVLRGALLDLLATGDVERTTDAVHQQLTALRHRSAAMAAEVPTARFVAEGAAPPQPRSERPERVFDGFEEFDVPTSGGSVHGRRGGDGPPVLLLHGIPETHVMWHRVAPQLAERFTVVASDLRGFGDSGSPPSAPDHAPHSMREVAGEQIEVMAALGHDHFAVVGHDRGARCAYRMTLDHPHVVNRLAVLDIVPTGDSFRRADMDFSLGFWVWSFLAAPEPVPERLIAHDPAVLVDHMLDSWSDVADAFPAAVRAEYIEKFRDPETVHAICEEYRAAATLDYQHDEADRGYRRITCPVLALWSATGAIASWYEPLEVWREWADEVSGGPLQAGHFLAEEAPEETTRCLLDFLATA